MGAGDAGLGDTTWRLEHVAGEPASEGVRSTVTFGPDDHVGGGGGVNQFAGSYRIVGDTIEFGQHVSTLMAGPPEAMDQEQRFLDVLSGTKRFAVDGDVLVIGDATLRRVEQLVVTGQVTYRQRIALPPSAVVIVQLLDVSRVDAPAEPVAEQRIAVEHQVPIPFTLTVDRAGLNPRRRHAVAARIEVDGRLAWTTDTPQPVDVAVDALPGLEITLVTARS